MAEHETHPDPAVRIGPLAQILREAQERLEELKKLAREASRAETAQLNQVNQAQKAFDETLAALRKSAPSDSDWHRKTRGRGIEVPSGHDETGAW